MGGAVDVGMNKNDCKGCYNDCYNHGLGGAKECFSFKNAKVQRMYVIGVNTPQDKRSNFKAVQVPSCYRQQGVRFYPELPEHLAATQ